MIYLNIGSFKIRQLSPINCQTKLIFIYFQMDVKHFNEFLIDLQTKDFSEVIQQIKEQLFLRKDMSATDIEKITEFLKHLKENGMNTVEKTTETIENVFKSYLEKL